VYRPEDRDEIKEMVINTHNCLNCGKRLKRGHGYKRTTGYCSWECYLKKPPKVVYLETLYNKPFRQLVVDLLNETGKVKIAADFLNMNKKNLYDWIKKLNIERVYI